jgi:hypothetical protein
MTLSLPLVVVLRKDASAAIFTKKKIIYFFYPDLRQKHHLRRIRSVRWFYDSITDNLSDADF